MRKLATDAEGSPARRRSVRTSRRRGNTIVLVVGVLVLLVIIATSFITRTHAGRVTAVSQQRAALRDDNAGVIGDAIAAVIAEALFPRAVSQLSDPSAFAGALADSGAPRRPPAPDAVRYGVDTQLGPGPDGMPGTPDDVLLFPYNFAPYWVYPFTNWPDFDPLDPLGTGGWPLIPNLGGRDLHMALRIGEGNPRGGPGFGDTRWLASSEPMRYVFDTTPMVPGGEFPAYTHWPHMSYLARPENGWRVVGDVANVDSSTMVTDLRVPLEQWLAIPPSAVGPIGESSVSSPQQFFDQWAAWFTYGGYQGAYADPALIPANFYRLADLDGNGTVHDWFVNGIPQDRPESEFIPGTARHTVSRVLADTDGDGYTDSFWHLAPTRIEGGIRQVVAVRIVDNGGMLNVNTATRFSRSTTAGATPADAALVGDMTDLQAYLGGLNAGDLNVGFLDNPAHWENYFPIMGILGVNPEDLLSPFRSTVIGWNPVRWYGDDGYDFLSQIGVKDHPGFSGGQPEALLGSFDERVRYWVYAGRAPFEALYGLTPFNLADELELRMFAGQNYPWILSRLERAINTTDRLASFLHSTNQVTGLVRQETSEYLDQLSNRLELVYDQRKNLTVYNGARNDIMPPWLWPSLLPLDYNGNGSLDADEWRQYMADMRKLDLRRPLTAADVDNDGAIGELVPGSPIDDDVNDDAVIDGADHHQLLAQRILRALAHGTENGGQGYFGPYTSPSDEDFESLRRAAAGLAANLVQYRDDDEDLLTLREAVRLPAMGALLADHDVRFLGMEPQPFLVEAIVAHVYRSGFTVPDGYTNTGHNLVHSDHDQSTIVVVQVANPFDEEIEEPLLERFRLRVFGNDVLLTGFGPMPAGQAWTFYSIEDTLGGEDLDAPWYNQMNLGAPLANARAVSWPSGRLDYDTANPEKAVEIVRLVTEAEAPSDAEVVVDRIDILGDLPPAPSGGVVSRFGDRVTEDLEQGTPPPAPVPPPPANAVPLQTYPGRDIESETHWVQWVHAYRAWAVDSNTDGMINPDESNPRYVFADRAITFGSDAYTIELGTITGLMLDTKFDTNLKDCASCPARDHSLQMLARDEDLDQVGELLNVWLFGHELGFDVGLYSKTLTTFSEFMTSRRLAGTGARVNRLRVRPQSVLGGEVGAVIGTANPTDLTDPGHAVRALPAGARLLEGFVLDGPGVNGASPSSRFLAQGFSGGATPGLINVSTAPVEVMRALPHLTRLVHRFGAPGDNPFVRLAEALVQYREKYNGVALEAPPQPNVVRSGFPAGPDYSDRGGDGSPHRDVRSERGIASVGEINLLTLAANVTAPPLLEPNDAWRVDFAGLHPFEAVAPPNDLSDLSTDLTHVPQPGGPVTDSVAEDLEEQNLLFAGLSNLVTTRSDVFTVYFKVRSFRQNPVTRVWDATDPEQIVDEARYVMLVDRSDVNRPTDKPRILYLEKLPR
jgi:hypothetical protein